MSEPMIAILGMEHCLSMLDQLPGRIQVNVARRSIRSGMVIVRDRARMKAPVRFGALKRSIIAFTGKGKIPLNKKDLVGLAATDVKGYVTIDKSYYTTVVRKSGKIGLKKFKRGQAPAPGQKRIRPINYGHLVEFGTKPHSLQKGASARYGRRGIGASHMHPGARPKPFLLEAFQETQVQAADAIRHTCEVELAKELKKMEAEAAAALQKDRQKAAVDGGRSLMADVLKFASAGGGTSP